MTAITTPFEMGLGPTPFLGPNYTPVYGSAGASPSGWTFGGGGNYPRPYTSFSQRLVEASNSLGPFAIPIGATNAGSGRLFISTSGPSLGSLAFRTQPWYSQNDGNTGHPTKAEWWDSCVKVVVQARNVHYPNHPIDLIEVAYNAIDPNGDTAYSNDNLQDEYVPPKVASDKNPPDDYGHLDPPIEIAAGNPDLYNWLLKVYGIDAAEWYDKNPSRPHSCNPFLPQGCYVPQANNNLTGGYLQASYEPSGTTDLGLVAQLRPEEVGTMIDIIQNTPRSHPASKNAIDTLDRWAKPGSNNRNKLIQMGILLDLV